MRSPGLTFVLALVAALFCALAGWQWRQGNFDTLFGALPTPVGERVYSSFTPDKVKFIRISYVNTTATFALREDGWQATSPWMDRMDPRAAVGIIDFTLGLRIQDSTRDDQIDPAKAGLKSGAISIRLEDADHSPLANFKLGRQTPLKAEVMDMEQPVSTVFIQPKEKAHRHHVYACTGDINPLFKDDLKFLRDHRPFYFNPLTLKKIRIRSQQGDLTLGRETPESPWRIVKPLDLPTDPSAIKNLLQGLYELRSVRVTDRPAVTLPAIDNTTKTSQIALVSSGSETETLLEIYPPESTDAREVKATVSNRPSTVFDLPLKPEPGLVSLADLPLTVNELRDPALTHLNIPSLQTITIQPSTGPEIVISRDPANPTWSTVINDSPCQANEENLVALIKAVTNSRATGFVSDAATDFTPWGLNRPILKLRFLASDNQGLELRFGLDTKGGCFVNRLGTPIVMRVDPSLLAAIAVHPYEWRHARLWSVDRSELLAIERKQGSESPLRLKYTDNDEKWQAEHDGKDLTDDLDPARASYMLSVLEGLNVSHWLSPADEAAATALATPSLSLTVLEKSHDNQDNFTGLSNRTVIFAPVETGPYAGFYFGRLTTESQPFLLNRDTYQKLAASLFEK